MKWERVLVSGSTGFIGTELTRQLQNYLGRSRVYRLNRRAKAHSRQNLRSNYSKASLVSLLERIRPSVFFHAAGGSAGAPDELIEGNMLTTLHLFQAMHETKFPMRAVILGSAAEYGDVRGRCSAARTPLRPITAYAWTKACQSLLALQSAEAGLDVVVARLFNLTGPRVPVRFSVGAFAQQLSAAPAKRPGELTVGNLKSTRDFLDIRDAVAGIITIARQGARGEIYDVCSGHSIAVSKLLQKLIQLSGRQVKVHRDAARTARREIARSVGDPGPLRRLGWRPRQSLEQSLRDTLNSYTVKAIISATC